MANRSLHGLAKTLTYSGLKHTPQRMVMASLAVIANQLLASRLRKGELDFLTGRYWEIAVTDVPKVVCLSVRNRKITVVRAPEKPDVAFHGPLRSFMLLTLQWEDPDTLFFNRQLSVSGDTELGLRIKNLLQDIEAQEILPGSTYEWLGRWYLLLHGANPPTESGLK